MTIITWKWNNPDYPVDFPASAVNTLQSMIERHTTKKHRFICITDDPEGIECETYPLWDDLRHVRNKHWKARKPQCYVRLKAFSKAFRKIAGERFVSIDLDTVITGNIDYILNRKEDFIINKGNSKKNDYNGALWMMDSGCRSHVYDNFKSEWASQASSMFMGSDQAWLRWILGRNEAVFSEGIYAFYKVHTPPKDCKIMFFHGLEKPWQESVQKRHEWIRKHYK